jgi:hypothetical protein
LSILITLEKPSEWDWDFDKVPDGELVACCYWEYARESAFIRDVRQRCLQNWQAGGHWDQKLNTDMQRLQSIGYPCEVFIWGFFLHRRLTISPRTKSCQTTGIRRRHRLPGTFPPRGNRFPSTSGNTARLLNQKSRVGGPGKNSGETARKSDVKYPKVDSKCQMQGRCKWPAGAQSAS